MDIPGTGYRPSAASTLGVTGFRALDDPGGGESDWLVIFDRYWDALDKADVYATRMRTAGLVVWLAPVGLVVAGMVLASRRAAAAAAGRPRRHVALSWS